MSEPANKSDKRSIQKTSKSQNTRSPVQIPRNLQNAIGNQAMLRLMRQSATENTPSIQRDMHEHGCSCPSCARIQRQREEKQLQRALIQHGRLRRGCPTDRERWKMA